MSLTPTAPYAPATVSDFDCIFINIVGPRIGAWEANSDQVGVGRNFSYIGQYSGLVSTTTGGVVSVKVNKGAQRYVQLIGVVSRVGCPASVSPSQLNSFTSFPGMFIIGSKQKDIFKTEKIKITSTYSVNNAADVRASEDEPRPVDDEDPPSAGANGILTLEKLSADSVKVSWTKATDLGTLSDQLRYKLAIASLEEEINEANEVDTLGQDVSDLNEKTVTGLDPAGTYYFNLLVEDNGNKKTLYQLNSISMSCTCPDGQYPSGGGCVAAEQGYWAASCIRSVCSNTIPANSSYSGTGTSTATCGWSCNTGYVANAGNTECIPAGVGSVGCAANEIMTGISAYLDPTIMAIGARCKTYSSGKPTGASKDGTFYGTGSLTETDCASGAMVSEIRYSNSATGINGIRFKCVDPDNIAAETWMEIGDTSSGTQSISCVIPTYFNTFYVGNDNADTAGPISATKICR